jgi:hypothetical protein
MKKIILTSFFLVACSEQNNVPDSNRSFFSPQEKTAIEQHLDVDMSRVDVEPRPLSDLQQRAIERDVAQNSKTVTSFGLQGDAAILQIMLYAQKFLDAKGESELSAQAAKEALEYTGIITRTYFVNADLIGDHEPISEYIDEMYVRLETALGKDLMRLTRLIDIKTVNYTAPVVFQPRGTRTDKWDIDEYRLHFVPFSGIVAYWSVFVACAETTQGVGVVTFVCAAVAEKSREKIEKNVAPQVSDVVYKEANL